MTNGVASSSIPLRRLGRYALYSEIASGGMATVYLGRQRGQAGFARTVAIKCLHPHHAKEPDFVAMFLDEAHLAARVRHPNVVPTLDVVATDGELFLVMEYVHGETLGRLLRAARLRNEIVPPRILATIAADVLHGLHAAHEATTSKGEPLGLVHRDVSPANILVGVDGVSRVVDFGVAKAAGRIQTTREGQVKGKIAYMAPEQILGSSSCRSDVYGASVVFWEALTTRRLFKGENEATVINQVINAVIEPPSHYATELDVAWDEIVLKGMARVEANRWATAQEMASEIEKRLPMARASEVSAWVKSLAHDALAKHAADVTAIERLSDGETAPPANDPASDVDHESRRTPSGITRESGVLASSASPPSPGRRRGRLVLAGFGLTAVVLSTWVVARSMPDKAAPQPAVLQSTAPAQAPVPLMPTDNPPSSVSTLASSAPSAVASTKPRPWWLSQPPPPPRPATIPNHPGPKPDSSSTPTKDATLGNSLDTQRILDTRH